REVADRGTCDDERAEEDRLSTGRGDDALRAGAGALHDATVCQIERLDDRGRVTGVEARDRSATNLAGEEERMVLAFHRECLLVIGHQDDLARANRNAEGRRRESAEHVDDDRMARRGSRAIEEARDADVQLTRVAVSVIGSYANRADV